MKKLALLVGMMVVTMGFFTTSVIAQDDADAGEAVTYSLPAMRILDLEGTAPSLTFLVPAEAGTAIADVTDNKSWINYTSVIGATTNKVTVVINKAAPAGTTLMVVAAAHAGTGNGTYGTPTAEKELTTSAVDLITAIGSCWTGTGNTNGHQLTYRWIVEAAEYADLVAAGAADITATYTITATTL